MNCNTEQKEVGGKDLLLKACKDFTAATTDNSESITITAHGAKVGDIVAFKEVGALTVFDVGIFYYVKEIVDANNLKLSLNKSGAAIEADATEASLDVAVFRGVGGVRSKSKSFNAEAIDITSEDSNEWKKTLDQAGMRSLSMSVEGVVTNSDNYNTVEDNAHANKLQCLLFINTKVGKLVECCFKVTSIETTGPHDAEATFNMSFESAGEPTFATIGV